MHSSTKLEKRNWNSGAIQVLSNINLLQWKRIWREWNMLNCYRIAIFYVWVDADLSCTSLKLKQIKQNWILMT